MRRIDHPTAMPDLNGPGKPGFTEGDPLIALPPTRVGADVLNAWQEEIARAVELVEPLNPNDHSQLARVIQRMARDAHANTWTKIGIVEKEPWGGASNVVRDGGFIFGRDAAWVMEWPNLLSWKEITLPDFAPSAAATWAVEVGGEPELQAVLVGASLGSAGQIRKIAGDTVTSPSSGVSTRLFALARRRRSDPVQDAFEAGFCAVGDDGVIVTSPDGVVWTERSSGTTARLTSVSWDWQTGRWVALGPYDGVIVTSSDGVVWATDDAPTWELLHIVQSDPGLMAWTADGEFYRTTDGGTTWTADARVGAERASTMVGAGFGGGRRWRTAFVGGPYAVDSHDVGGVDDAFWSPRFGGIRMPWGRLVWADRISPTQALDGGLVGRVLAVTQTELGAEVWLSGKGL